MIEVDPQYIDKIVKELVEPAYYDDVKYNINSRNRWKKISDITSAFSQILFGISIIMSFAVGFFDINMLSFISGSIGVSAMVVMKISSYAMNESRERTNQINIILKKLNISEIPDITIDPTINNIMKKDLEISDIIMKQDLEVNVVSDNSNETENLDNDTNVK